MGAEYRLTDSACEFFVIPHTHWDREWYRPFEYFQLALGRVVDGVLDVLERDPSFTSFTLDGQAIVLEDYLEVRPGNEARLRALVEAGRIELGPSYVLPDEFLVGAEALVRNLLIGRTVCRRFGAEPAAVGYLPDSFGHPLQIPQILAGFGIGSFVFSRGMGDEIDEVGLAFRWQAPEGSEVLALQLLDHYGNFAFVSGPDEGEARVRGILERFGPWLDRAGIRQVALCNGTDHVPVNAELPRLVQELEDRLSPSRLRIAKYADYVDAVRDADVPAWSGELVGSRIQNVLRGVNSARLYVKRANEAAERRLTEVEALGALRTLEDGSLFPAADFDLAWRQLLRCHPHDTICGCSCDEVHRDAMARYESLHRTLSLLQARALDGLALGDAGPDTVGVINVLPYRRCGLVELPEGGESLLELDGFSARVIEVPSPGTPSLGADPHHGSAVIESDRFRIEATTSGALELLDKQTGRRFAGLHVLEDQPDMGDLYNFCPVAGAAVWRSDRTTARVLRDGPVVWELELRAQATRPAGLAPGRAPADETVPLTVSTVVRLVQGSHRIEFRTTIDNAARDHRLRVGFPAGPADGPVRAETAFAVARRPAEPPTPQTRWVEPPDPTQHTLGAVAFGAVALLTKGLPEYEARASASQGELWLTLLRCVGVISQPEGALATRPHTAGPQVPTPEGQCLGRQEADYALLPDGGALDDGALLREAQDYRHGFLVTDPVALGPGLSLEGNVVFSCLKGAEDGDGLILRCFNPGDEPAGARIGGPVLVWRARLDETGETPLERNEFELAPGAIGTLRLRPLSSSA